MIRIAKISHEGRQWNAEPFPPHFKMMSVGGEYLLAESAEEWEDMKARYFPAPKGKTNGHPVVAAVKRLLTYLNLN